MKTTSASLIFSHAGRFNGADDAAAWPRPRFWPRRFAAMVLALTGFAALTARASDPIGIYALPEKVVLEPNETHPERIQIWGAFALAKPGNGSDYDSARRGYLYYKLNAEKKEACLKEWADLKSTAGTGQCLGLGSRYQEKGTIRDAAAKPKDPDTYPVAFGVTKVNDKTYKPVKELLDLSAAKPARPGSKSP